VGSLFKRYRELVVVGLALVLPLVIYASHAEEAVTPGPLRRAVVAVTAPLQQGVLGLGRGVTGLWRGYVDLRGLRAENQRLKDELDAARTQQARLAELEHENGRLRSLAQFAERSPRLHLLTAAVIGQGGDARFRALRISRGSADGLAAGQPVVTAEGLVGRVIAVYAGYADVLLLTDPASAVAVVVQRTRTRATVRGGSAGDRLRLDYVLKTDALADGDELITPGGTGLPKGLRVGRAVEVDAVHGLFKSARVMPFVDFDRLEFVQVVLSDDGHEGALEPSTAAAGTETGTDSATDSATDTATVVDASTPAESDAARVSPVQNTPVMRPVIPTRPRIKRSPITRPSGDAAPPGAAAVEARPSTAPAASPDGER